MIIIIILWKFPRNEPCVKQYYDPITTDLDQNSDRVNKHTPVFAHVVLLRRAH